MTSEERAWLAGLLEGEAWFGIHTSKVAGVNPRLLISLQMTDQDVVERAAKLMGTTLSYVHPRKPPRKAIYQIHAGGLCAEDVMRTIRPLMGTRRGKQIDTALSTPNLSHYGRIERAYRVEKECTRCTQTKPLNSFGRAGHTIDGRQSWCKDCANADGRRRHALNKGTLNAARRERRKKEKGEAS